MRTPKLRVYKAKDGYRWRLRAKNGRILCDGAEAYKNRRDCIKGIARSCGAFISLERWVIGELQRGVKR